MPIHLRAARVNAGLTQEAAAIAVGISKGTLRNYETYETKPDIETAQKLAKLYGLTVDGIIFCKPSVL
jgi:DNA-binding XRE family transcriptional regulator